jgi:hypothetical protein
MHGHQPDCSEQQPDINTNALVGKVIGMDIDLIPDFFLNKH